MPQRNSQNEKPEAESNTVLINLQKIIKVMENSIEKKSRWQEKREVKGT